LKAYVGKLVSDISAGALFAQMPTIHFSPELEICPLCSAKLQMQKSRRKTVVTMDIGAFVAKETILQCPNDQAVFTSQQLRALSPDKCTFGFDVIVHVGMAMFVDCQNERQIMKNLAERNVFISEREIGYLGRKFIVYLALAHQESRDQLRQSMTNTGGYILHLDGTCEGDSAHLFCGLDGISELVLDSIKVPSERRKVLIPFLRRIREQYGDPLALMHDMSAGILSAVKEVFPGIADFICHFHFLRDIGKDLLLQDYQTILNRLRKHEIRSSLRQKATYCERKVEGNSQAMVDFIASLENGELKTTCIEAIPTLATYTLADWILEGPGQSYGYGFPFDRRHLDFHQRLKPAHSLLEKIMNVRLGTTIKDNKPLFQVWRLLEKAMKDKKLGEAVATIEAKAEVFDKLRQALGIALPEGKNGLNDMGQGDIETIESNVKEFRAWIVSDKHRKKTYAKMIDQLDKYWDKLFADPILVNTPQGPVLIVFQRTNNILEQLFRGEKRRGRKKSGTASLSKTLKAIHAQTPLVRNLENPEYFKIILNGCSSLEERFSQIDSRRVQEELRQAAHSGQRLHPELKRLVKQPDLPNKISVLFGVHAR
jgi:hypothetical protein